MNCPKCNTPNRAGARYCQNCNYPLPIPRDANGAIVAGTTLENRYQVRQLLGMGGFGAVYLVDDRRLTGRQCALKETFDNSPDAQRQFKQEAELLARLNHPQLVRVTDYFSTPAGEHFLVMDYVPGEDLAQVLARTPGFLPEAQVVEWIKQVCAVLEYMHTWVDPHTGQRTPIIHRDLKPGNLKLRPDGKIMVIDLGIAKAHVPGQKTTRAAQAYSLPYSPLEQYGTGTDERSDVYALGVTLYQLLTKQLPPAAPDLSQQPLPPPRQYNPQITPPAEQVILKAMQLQAVARYESAAEMHQALQDIGARVALPVKPAKPAPSKLRPRPRPIAQPAKPLHVRLGKNIVRLSKNIKKYLGRFIGLLYLIIITGSLELGTIAFIFQPGNTILDVITALVFAIILGFALGYCLFSFWLFFIYPLCNYDP